MYCTRPNTSSSEFSASSFNSSSSEMSKSEIEPSSAVSGRISDAKVSLIHIRDSKLGLRGSAIPVETRFHPGPASRTRSPYIPVLRYSLYPRAFPGLETLLGRGRSVAMVRTQSRPEGDGHSASYRPGTGRSSCLRRHGSC